MTGEELTGEDAKELTGEYAEELVDPDADSAGAGGTGQPERPGRWFPRAGTIGLVFLGGALGVTARILLLLVLPDDALAVLAANLAGALLLGVLLELVAGRARLTGLRPLLGTGLLGGFTTYSAFAVDAVLLGTSGAGYVAASLLGGLVAAGAGVALGRGLRRFAR